MQADAQISSAMVLLGQGRYTDAEKTLSELMASDPNDIQVLALLAEAKLNLDKTDQAIDLINNAIGLSPESPELHYIKSRALIDSDSYDLAMESIQESIALDPNDADYFAILANIHLAKKNFEKALDAANTALSIDSENLLALNMRSTALTKLDRKEEAFTTIEGALREDPNNPTTHANYGWGLLEAGDHKKALEHFKESLKKQPDNAYAQAGMLEAIKAGNPIYRGFLKFSFWMSNLTAQYQWGVLIGFYFGTKMLRGLAASNPGLQPYLVPLIVLLTILAFSTWVIQPLSNLFLRFHPYGKYLLQPEEKQSSNWVAISLGVFVLGILLYFLLSEDTYLALAVYGFAMMIPLSAAFTRSASQKTLMMYTLALGVIGALALLYTFKDGELYNGFTTIFLLGFFAFQWLANHYRIKESNY